MRRDVFYALILAVLNDDGERHERRQVSIGRVQRLVELHLDHGVVAVEQEHGCKH